MKKASWGSNAGIGCQLGCFALLIPWILSAAMIQLFPRFAYGFAERWVCPADSSVQVEGTEGWLFAVFSDDEAVPFPQFACVDARGTVVRRGDESANVGAYLLASGVFLVGFFLMEITGVGLISRNGRKPRITT